MEYSGTISPLLSREFTNSSKHLPLSPLPYLSAILKLPSFFHLASTIISFPITFSIPTSFILWFAARLTAACLVSAYSLTSPETHPAGTGANRTQIHWAETWGSRREVRGTRGSAASVLTVIIPGCSYNPQSPPNSLHLPMSSLLVWLTMEPSGPEKEKIPNKARYPAGSIHPQWPRDRHWVRCRSSTTHHHQMKIYSAIV